MSWDYQSSFSERNNHLDIAFALTSIRDELFQLHLHFLDRFLLFNMHGENDLSCDYNVHCGAVRDLGDINPRH